EGNDTLIGGAGNDRFFGMDDDDRLEGGDGDDFLIANAGNDTVFGDAGNDNLRGRAGDDYLSGGDGNDFILADEGNDTLTGDGGFDTLFGGAGSDTFVFAGNWRRDTIGDWDEDFDVIDLSALGLKGAGESNADAFAKLTLVQDGTTAIISVTGDTSNDIRLSNTDVSTLDAADFLFDVPPTPPAASAAQSASDSFDFTGLPAVAPRAEVIALETGAEAGTAPGQTSLAFTGSEASLDFAAPFDGVEGSLILEDGWATALG
ncbi:MAG: calcium-binding protein, partial [Pseudomonadota bacterium]